MTCRHVLEDGDLPGYPYRCIVCGQDFTNRGAVMVQRHARERSSLLAAEHRAVADR